MKINIGSGDLRYEDYVTIDNNPHSNPDFLLDLEKDTLPFEDSSVEFVIAHHILEHLGDGFFHCLKELYRVCKHGAVIDVRVPHPRHESFLADPTHKRSITPMTFQLFSQKFNQMSKEQNYASSRLGEQYGVDFEVVVFDYILDEDAKKALSSLSREELSAYSSHHNNIISEIHIKLSVIKK